MEKLPFLKKYVPHFAKSLFLVVYKSYYFHHQGGSSVEPALITFILAPIPLSKGGINRDTRGEMANISFCDSYVRIFCDLVQSRNVLELSDQYPINTDESGRDPHIYIYISCQQEELRVSGQCSTCHGPHEPELFPSGVLSVSPLVLFPLDGLCEWSLSFFVHFSRDIRGPRRWRKPWIQCALGKSRMNL